MNPNESSSHSGSDSESEDKMNNHYQHEEYHRIQRPH